MGSTHPPPPPQQNLPYIYKPETTKSKTTLREVELIKIEILNCILMKINKSSHR